MASLASANTVWCTRAEAWVEDHKFFLIEASWLLCNAHQRKTNNVQFTRFNTDVSLGKCFARAIHTCHKSGHLCGSKNLTFAVQWTHAKKTRKCTKSALTAKPFWTRIAKIINAHHITPRHTNIISNTELLVEIHAKSVQESVTEEIVTAQNITQFAQNDDRRTCPINFIVVSFTSTKIAKFWSRVLIFVREFDIR